MTSLRYVAYGDDKEEPLRTLEIGEDEDIISYGKRLGSGSYGNVYSYNDSYGIEYAVKVMSLDEDKSINGSHLNDVGILKNLEHPNIVKLVDVGVSENNIYLVMKKAKYDLGKYIRKFGNQKDDIPYLIYPLVEAMAYYFNMNTLHLDIKPQNILYFEGEGLKFTDFGISKQGYCNIYPYYTGNMAFSLWYRSPDIIMGNQNYDTFNDIWALGCVIYEFYTGKPLFVGDEHGIIKTIFKRLGTPDEKIWPGVNKLPMWNNYKDYRYKRSGFNEKEITTRPELLNLLNKIFDYRNFSKPYGSDYISEILKHEYFDEINNYGNITHINLGCYDKLMLKDNYPKHYESEHPNNYDKIWILQICNNYRLKSTTLFMSYYILDSFYDLFASNSGIDHKLIALVCLQISSLMNQSYSTNLEIYKLIETTGNMFTIKEFTKAQKYVVQKLDWKIAHPTSYDIFKVASYKNIYMQSIGETILIALSMSDIIYKIKPSLVSKIATDITNIYFGNYNMIHLNKMVLAHYILPHITIFEDSNIISNIFNYISNKMNEPIIFNTHHLIMETKKYIN